MTAAPPCTGGHDQNNRAAHDGTLIDLPCGCQDVHFTDGTTCFEHNHAQCDGTPEAAATKDGETP